MAKKQKQYVNLKNVKTWFFQQKLLHNKQLPFGSVKSSSDKPSCKKPSDESPEGCKRLLN